MRVISLMPIDGVYHPTRELFADDITVLNKQSVSYSTEIVPDSYMSEYRSKVHERVSAVFSDYFLREGTV
jgi:hypothetical protein